MFLVADVPPAVVQVAQQTQRQEQGIVLYHLRRVFDVHAGFMHRHEELELAIVSANAQTVKVRVLRSQVDGKPSDAARIAQIENQYEHAAPADVFRRPFDPLYAGEYTYQRVDAATYRFTSVVRDSSHGDGTFTVDESGNVVRCKYTPNVLPRYTTSGSVTVERAQVVPGIWATVREDHAYRGRYAIFSGGATVAITYEGYKRYPDVPDALAALASATP